MLMLTFSISPVLAWGVTAPHGLDGVNLLRGGNYRFACLVYTYGIDEPVSIDFAFENIDPLEVIWDPSPPFLQPGNVRVSYTFNISVPNDAPVGEYYIMMWVRGIDSGIHFTVWVVGPPDLQVLLPEDVTYITSCVPLNFTVDTETNWLGYSLDNEPNVTIAGNTTIQGLSDGSHHVTVYATEPVLFSQGASEKVFFTVRSNTPVGGEWTPTNGLQLSAPLISLVATVAIAVSFVGVRRVKKRQD
jgi:hypothetical protein